MPVMSGRGPNVRDRRAPWIWLLGAVTLLVVVAVVVVAAVVETSDGPRPRRITATGSTSTPSSVPPVPVSALDDLLLTPVEVAAAVSAPALVPLSRPAESHSLYSDDVVDSDCVGVAFAATRQFYEGSGWVSVRKLTVADTADVKRIKQSATEAVVAFPDATVAAKFYRRALDVFRKCAKRSINLRHVDESATGEIFMMVGQIYEKDGVVSTSLLQEGGDGWNCQRGISADNNLVIDTDACGLDVSAAVVPALIKPIAERISSMG